MEQSIDYQIDLLVKESKIHRFSTELENTSNAERKENIEKILDILQGIKPKEKTVHEKLNEMHVNMDSFALKRKWTKLTNIQKKERIENFITTKYIDKNVQKIVLEKVLKKFDQGKIKQKMVSYDLENGVILSIDFEEEESKPKKIKKKVIKVNNSSSD